MFVFHEIEFLGIHGKMGWNLEDYGSLPLFCFFNFSHFKELHFLEFLGSQFHAKGPEQGLTVKNGSSKGENQQMAIKWSMPPLVGNDYSAPSITLVKSNPGKFGTPSTSPSYILRSSPL